MAECRRMRKADINDIILNQTDFMSSELTELLGKQVINELSSAYLYFAMSAKCATASYNGFSKFFYEKAEEEIEHANKVKNLMIEMNKPIKFYAIPEINFIGSDLIEIFKQFLESEKKVTQQWLEIKDASLKDRNFASFCLNETIDWFLNEQITEESEASGMLKLLTKARGDMSAILTIENRLFGEK